MADPVDTSDPRRRPGIPATVARLVFITTVALSLGTVVLSGLDGHALAGFRVLPAVAFAVMGMLIVARRAENPLGWLFCAVGIAIGASACSQEFARRVLIQAPGSMPGGEVAAWLAGWTPLVSIGLLLGVLPHLFPTGRPLGRRWQVGLWAAWAFIALGVVGNAFAPQDIEGVPGVLNPYGVESAGGAFDVVQAVAGVFGLVALVGGLASLVVRWRRASGEEAQQLKWFAAGIAVLPVLALVHGSAPSAVDAAFVVALPFVPVTMGVAILRHRLYDLDLVINRVVVYAGLSAMVTGPYLAIVVLSEWALGGSAAVGVHAAAALAVAATFQPLRSRTQSGVDRLFYGDRSRPYDALARLGRRLQDAVVPGSVLPGVVESVAGALRVPYVAIEVPRRPMGDLSGVRPPGRAAGALPHDLPGDHRGPAPGVPESGGRTVQLGRPSTAGRPGPPGRSGGSCGANDDRPAALAGRSRLGPGGGAAATAARPPRRARPRSGSDRTLSWTTSRWPRPQRDRCSALSSRLQAQPLMPGVNFGPASQQAPCSPSSA